MPKKKSSSTATGSAGERGEHGEAGEIGKHEIPNKKKPAAPKEDA